LEEIVKHSVTLGSDPKRMLNGPTISPPSNTAIGENALRKLDEVEERASPKLAIVVLDRGFVYIGNVSVNEQWCRITDAANIRYWGTTRGLGQLALEGPQSATRIDSVGSIDAPRAVIHIIYLSKEALQKWQTLLR